MLLLLILRLYCWSVNAVVCWFNRWSSSSAALISVCLLSKSINDCEGIGLAYWDVNSPNCRLSLDICSVVCCSFCLKSDSCCALSDFICAMTWSFATHENFVLADEYLPVVLRFDSQIQFLFHVLISDISVECLQHHFATFLTLSMYLG